jgi:hypothetical protein
MNRSNVGMITQMADQMDVPEREAGGLMDMAEEMNDAEGFSHGGMARVKGCPPVQVKGFTYNDNDGKGTF